MDRNPPHPAADARRSSTATLPTRPGPRRLVLGRARLAAVVWALAGPSQGALLVVNGDFEASPSGSGWSQSATTAFAPITLYNTCCGPLSGAYTGGSNAAFFGWDDKTGGSVWQDVPTQPGLSYVLDFDYGAIGVSTAQAMRVRVTSGVNGAQLDLGAIGGHALDQLLTGHTLSFTAADVVTRLTFEDISTSTNDVDGVLDNVSLRALPTPGSLSLSLAAVVAASQFRRARPRCKAQ